MADTGKDKAHPAGVKEGDAELQEQLDTLLSTLNKAESGLQSVEAAPNGDAATGETLAPAIDALLTEARAENNTANPADHTAPTTALIAASAKTSPTAAPIAASATDAPEPSAEQDILGEDLANQIQELLDSTAESMGGGVKLAALEETVKSPKPSASPAPSPAAEPPSISPPIIKPALVTRAENARIKALDATLADGADDAIAGDFETTEEVIPGVSNPAAQPTTAATAHAPTAVGDPPVKNLPDIEEEPALEGDFESPAELAARAAVKDPVSAAGFSAGAADVAKELDSQPEKKASGTPPTREPAQARRASTFTPAALAKGLFVLLNRPLANASIQTRNLVGWIGLITLFNATLLIAGSMVMRPGHDGAAPSAPTKHAAAAKESSEGEEGAATKPAPKKAAHGHH